MRLWKPRSITYKTHFFSALCRSIYTNSCWIFGTSLFVKVVGSKGYSKLYFFASVLALLYYVYFAIRGQKDREPYTVYKTALILSLLASAGCFLEPFSAFLVPYNELLIYLFVVSVMTVDLIGTTLGPIVLQSSVNPAIFRRVYQQIVTSEVIARIAAAALVWILSQGHLLTVLYPIAWSMLILHFILFGITVWRMRVSGLKDRAQRDSAYPVIENLNSSVRFLLANPLVRVAMIMMVWAVLTKFLLEYVVYQAADARFHSARQVASFLSATTLVIYMLSLFVHHFVSRKLTARLQLSTLMCIQPVNIVVLGGLALVSPPFWPLVLLMVTYNIIHRSIQLPMTRQCLVPVPRHQRGTIVSLISLIVSVVTIITTGTMAMLNRSLNLSDFVIMLVVLGSAIFFVITGLDSFYIRNLFSYFRETTSGTWEAEPQSESLSSAELESEAELGEAASSGISDLKSQPVIETYAFSQDRDKLSGATREHKHMLHSTNPDLRIQGLRICFIAGFPWFQAVLTQAAAHDDPKIRRFAQNALAVNKSFPHVEAHPSAFRRRIKAVAMELVERGESERQMRALENLSKLADREGAEQVVSALTDSRFKELRTLLLSLIDEDGLTVMPIVNRMFDSDYESARPYRALFQHLSFSKTNADLRALIDTNLCRLKRGDLFSPNGGETQLERFMHTLFLEEYRLSARDLDGALIDTIADFKLLAPEEREVLIDMHLSFLKRSEQFPVWQSLML